MAAPAARVSVTVLLACHPASPTSAVRAIDVRAEWRGEILALRYRLEGEIGRLHIPAPRPARIAEQLWRHTCFEAFVAPRGTSAYHELNFSPSGEWAAYAFERYRVGQPVTDASLEPQVAVRCEAGALELTATVRLARLGTTPAGGPILLGLSAVMEERSGALSYWALAHPSEHPDFHDRRAFTLELTDS
jgi:hypothetical protein